MNFNEMYDPWYQGRNLATFFRDPTSAAVFAKYADFAYGMSRRGGRMGVSHAYAQAADLDRALAIHGGTCWIRLTPEHGADSGFVASFAAAKLRGMKVLVCGLTPTPHPQPDIVNNTDAKTQWRAYWSSILQYRPDAIQAWNEPNLTQFTGGAPNASLTTALHNEMVSVAQNVGFTGKIISPAFAPKGDARTDPFSPLEFLKGMMQADPSNAFVKSLDGVDVHAYTYNNNGSALTTPWYWNPVMQQDQMAILVKTAKGSEPEHWWSEYGAPAAGTSGTYVGSPEAQLAQITTLFTAWQNRLDQHVPMGVKMVHRDNYDASDGARDMSVTDQNGVWRPAAFAILTEANKTP